MRTPMKFIGIISFLLVFPAGARADDALSFTKTAYAEMVAVRAAKPDVATAKLKEKFDFDGFYARVTPDFTGKMTPEENARLKKAFMDLFFANFSKNAGNVFARQLENPAYSVRETKPEYSVVAASGKFKGADAALGFFVRPDAAGKWKMVDIEVDSVLLSRNYRGSFNRVFREKGLPGLVEKLEAKLREIAPAAGAVKDASPSTPAK